MATKATVGKFRFAVYNNTDAFVSSLPQRDIYWHGSSHTSTTGKFVKVYEC